MTLLMWLAACGLAIDTVLVACYVIFQWHAGAQLDLAPFFVAGGACLALFTFLTNLRRARSQDVLSAACDFLEKSYETLVVKDSPEPSNNRRTWLTSARLLKTAESLAERLVEASHRKIYEQTREYWRGKLYDLIYPTQPEGLPSTFYADEPDHMLATINEQRSPLSEKSLAYLYRFIQWPDKAADPIGEVAKFTEDEIHKMQTFGPRGLGNLMVDVRKLQDKVFGKSEA